MPFEYDFRNERGAALASLNNWIQKGMGVRFIRRLSVD